MMQGGHIQSRKFAQTLPNAMRIMGEIASVDVVRTVAIIMSNVPSEHSGPLIIAVSR